MSEYPVSRGRRVAAVLVALVAPAGAGHLVLGRLQRALGWSASMLAVYALTLFWPVPAVMVVAFIGLLSIVDAALISSGTPALPSVGRAVLYVVVFALVVTPLRYVERALLVEPFVVPSSAMEPTLLPGDHFLVDHTVHDFEHGDIVAFHTNGLVVVSRVAALGGDTVTIREGQPVELNRAGASAEPCKPALRKVIEDIDCTVPAGTLFVLGDNLEHSYDSRIRGPTPLSDVIGRAMAIHFSSEGFTIRWSRIGTRLDQHVAHSK